jgi:hypothetical protein
MESRGLTEFFILLELDGVVFVANWSVFILNWRRRM